MFHRSLLRLLQDNFYNDLFVQIHKYMCASNHSSLIVTSKSMQSSNDNLQNYLDTRDLRYLLAGHNMGTIF